MTPAPLLADPAYQRRQGPGRQLAFQWLRGWAAVVHLVLDFALAVPYLLLGVLGLVGLATIPAFGAGILVLVVALALARVIAAFERVRLQAFTGHIVPPPPPPDPELPAWRRLLLDGRPWKAIAYAIAITVWGFTVGSLVVIATACGLSLAALPAYRAALPGDRLDLLGAATVPAGWWWSPIGLLTLLALPLAALALIRVDAALVQALLGPSRVQREQLLRQRVETLTVTRVATVDSVEAERRRIERDLHDGPQQRLVAIAMDLGLARERLGDDPARARELVDHAHTAAKEAIVEMRQVARGIHPPILSHRGLDAALSALAAGSPVPVQVSVQLASRPSPTLESIAYFCVSEALTNVAKHAQAHQAWVDVRQLDGRLVVRISDDGVGGADPMRGTGLVGLRQRAASVDGTVDVNSPVGGPTVLIVTLPDLPVPDPRTSS